MKKFGLYILIFVFLALPFVFYGCKNASAENLSSYAMQLSYDEKTHILKGNESVSYYNNSTEMLSAVYFHLYPNVYKLDGKNKIVSQSHIERAYPNGESEGNIEINYVKLQSDDVQYVIEGEGENLLKINLPDGLYPGQNVQIEIDFIVTLANINHRLGYGENTINFGNFYPIVCVYENGSFRKDAYSSNGDPFYSEIANYDVQLTYSSDYKLATGGDIISSENTQNLTITRVKALKMRDYSFVLSKNFKISSQRCGDVVVNYYGYVDDQNNGEALKTCIDCLSFFNKTFGDYPYNQLSVVKSNFVYGGMEYPGLVIISDEMSSREELNYVIIHEIAHQWWYGVVGSDQVYHAWQDEGLAEFSTLLFFKNCAEYGQNYNTMVNGALESYRLFERVYKNIKGETKFSMDRAIYNFETEPEYTQCTYTKGLLMFDALMQDIGEKKLVKGLKKYYKDYAFKNATPHDLIYCLSKGSGYDVEGYIKSWLDGKVVI